MSTMTRRSSIVKGQKFAISIDCEEVMGSVVPPEVVPTTNGTSTEDDTFPPDPAFNETTNSLIFGFGDLGPGIYSVVLTLLAGSVNNTYVVDNLGDELANTAALAEGQTQQLDFRVEADVELMGVGLIVPTKDNETQVSWRFSGVELPPSSPAQSGSPNGAVSFHEDIQIGVRHVMAGFIGWMLW